MSDSIQFFVNGQPSAQGSKRAYISHSTGRAMMTDQNKNLDNWRHTMGAIAAATMRGRPPMIGSLSAMLVFVFPRPKGHYRKNGDLKDIAPTFKESAPDVDKLQRAAFDAMTGIVYVDDSRIAQVTAQKEYVGGTYQHPGCFVRISPLSATEK